jgi:hypothetical protein
VRASRVCGVIGCPVVTQGTYCNRHEPMSRADRLEEEREIRRREKPFWELRKEVRKLQAEGGNPAEVSRLKRETERARRYMAELFGDIG